MVTIRKCASSAGERLAWQVYLIYLDRPFDSGPDWVRKFRSEERLGQAGRRKLYTGRANSVHRHLGER